MRYVVILAALGLCPAGTVVELIELHGPNGQISYLNPREISSLRQPINSDLERHFAKGTRCIAVTTNGKFLATRETCQEIRHLLLDGHPAK